MAFALSHDEVFEEEVPIGNAEAAAENIVEVEPCAIWI